MSKKGRQRAKHRKEQQRKDREKSFSSQVSNYNQKKNRNKGSSIKNTYKPSRKIGPTEIDPIAIRIFGGRYMCISDEEININA